MNCDTYPNLSYKIIGSENDELQMLYAADGALLQRKYVVNGMTKNKIDYEGDKEWHNDTLKIIHHNDGRVLKNNTTLTYEYTLKDHLGNTRVTFSDSNNDNTITSTERKSKLDYYSFGMEHYNAASDSEYGNPKNRNRYNGKEMVEEMGWNNLMYGYRNFDPTLGRFTTTDLLADGQESYNTYHYTYNNPMKYVDLFGLLPSDYRVCPNCPPFDPTFDPHRDSKDLYTYDPLTHTASLTLDEVIIRPKKKSAAKPDPMDPYATAWQVADIYDTFLHNHKTYKTTKNVVKPIYKPNGQVRSMRAQKFVNISKGVKWLGPLGDTYTIYTLNQKEKLDAWDYADGTVAFVSIAAFIVAGVVSAPAIITGAAIIGVVGAIYGTARLGYSIYENINYKENTP